MSTFCCQRKPSVRWGKVYYILGVTLILGFARLLLSGFDKSRSGMATILETESLWYVKELITRFIKKKAHSVI